MHICIYDGYGKLHNPLGSQGFAHWVPWAGLLSTPGGPTGGDLEGGRVPRVP